MADDKQREAFTKAQKAALQLVFRTYCTHTKNSYDGKTVICTLKEFKERCEYSNWTTWADCPIDCPHHLMKTKVTCTPDKCAIANRFVTEVREALKTSSEGDE